MRSVQRKSISFVKLSLVAWLAMLASMLINEASCNQDQEIANFSAAMDEPSTSSEATHEDSNYMHEKRSVDPENMGDDILRIFKTQQGLKFKKHSLMLNSALKRQMVEPDFGVEFELCTSCFLERSRSAECAFCYDKYSFKASKKVVNPTKYWYSRAG